MKKKINEVFTGWANNKGIWYYIISNRSMPWTTSGALSETVLDLDYHGLRSGNKRISVLVNNLLSDDGTISDANAQKIGDLIYYKYITSWQKIWDAITAQYNPVENYSRNTSTQTTHNGTRTPNLTDTETRTGRNDETENERYGFGGTDATPTDKSTTTYAGTNTKQQTGTESESATDIVAELVHGNIGVTTNQQMITEEIKLRAETYINIINADVDKILTSMVY